jgi:hypothetical protein
MQPPLIVTYKLPRIPAPRSFGTREMSGIEKNLINNDQINGYKLPTFEPALLY